MKSLIHLSAVLITTALFQIVSLAQDAALKTERFLLTFVPNIQFSPLYLGIAQHDYADIGLELSVEYLNEPDVLDLVAAGQAPFGVVSGEQVIVAAENERPIVYVYEWFQQYPVGIVFNADSPIQSVADLKGLRVGIPGRFGASYTGLTALLLSVGMTENDIQLEEIGFNAPEVFCMGAVDAAVVYINNEPLQIRHRAQAGDCGEVKDVRVIPVAQGSDLVSNGLITNKNLVANDPEFVRSFVAAFDKGLRDVINNPARAYLLSEAFVENLPMTDAFRAALQQLSDEQGAFLATNPDREAIAASRRTMLDTLLAQFDSETLIQFEVLLASIDLWDAERPGFSDASGWENMQNTLMAMRLLEGKVNLDLIYSNGFLPEMGE